MDIDKWSTKLDYVLTMLGFSTGWGIFLKFPYLCMRNGGGAFLIPFLLFTVIGAIPCVFLEMIIGQFSQCGPVTVWNICPSFKGIGIGTVLISVFHCSYFATFMAWFTYYLYYSFSAALPWLDCDNEWNTASCISSTVPVSDTKASNSNGIIGLNFSLIGNTSKEFDVTPGMTAAEEFLKYNMLDITQGLEDIGSVRAPIVLCLAITYIVVYLFMLKGIKVSGKIVYVTVGLPYLIITTFLVRGCLLPGSTDGIYFYIYPKFEKLADPRIWVEALSYALYSLGIAMGVIVTMARHNKFNNNCLRDAVVITLVDALTTIYVGFAFFAIMGHVAHIRGVTVDDFESSGFNLGFIVYPQAVASLPLPQLWSILTFVLLYMFGIDTLVPTFEIIVTAVTEQFPKLGYRRWLINLLVLVPFSLISLVYTSQGGMYVLTLVDWYAFFPSMAVFATLECTVITWIYGIKRMQSDIMMMWGRTMPKAMEVCLKFICPALTLVLFCYSLYTYRPPKYGDYIYPNWATVIGWMISLASVIPIPGIFIWTVYKTKGDTIIQRVRNAVQPSPKWRAAIDRDPLTQPDTAVELWSAA